MPLPTPEGPDIMTGRRSVGSCEGAGKISTFLALKMLSYWEVDVLGAIVNFRGTKEILRGVLMKL